jgi:molecular chaperone DnaJ
MRVRGQGVSGDANDKSPNGKSQTKKGGDLLVTIEVLVPTELTDPQREAVEGLAAVVTDDPRAALFEKQHNRRSSDG